MAKPNRNAFTKQRGRPVWASSKVLQQNRKRARLVAKGISGHETKAEMRRLGALAIGQSPSKPSTD